MKIIEVKNLCYSYNSKESAVDHMSFSIEQGSYVSILGHNGSGKSTLAKLLMGLLNPSSGEIVIDGEKLTSENCSKIRQKMALVFQNPDNQFIGATVEDDVAFGLENRMVNPKDMKDIIFKYLKLVGMEDFFGKEPSNLSGGQKQRVAIAGALALSPEILILDEATSMLDPKGRKEINDLISDLRKENPKLTIISITHDVNEALYSDEIILISSGKVSKCGIPDEIFCDEKIIQEHNLIYPFFYKLKNELEKSGYDVSGCKNEEDLADLICR